LNPDKNRFRVLEISLNRDAIIAGYGLLFMTIIALACVPTLENLFILDDTQETLKNITVNEPTFRFAVLGFAHHLSFFRYYKHIDLIFRH
jgi:hypothetical protein